jgi:uncharacterized phage protein (TIGR02220 family)
MAQTAEIIQLNERRDLVEESSSESLLSSGYIRLYRSLQDSSFSNKPEYVSTWMHMLMLATHKPMKTMVGKVTVLLAPGQFVSGRKALSKIVGVSEQSMRTIISYFEQEKMISKSSNRNGTVFSVLNFSAFQGKKINQPATNKNNQQINQAKTTYLKASGDIATKVITNTKLNQSTTKQENNNLKDYKDTVDKLDTGSACSEIISYLNEKAGKGFKNLPASQKFIKARLGDGHTISDLKAVIDHKTAEWKNDRKMVAYLRPSTLFNASNFEGYLSIVNLDPIVSHNQNSNEIDWNDTTWANDLNSDEGVNLI